MNPVLRIALFGALGIAYLWIAHIGATVGEPAWLIVLAGCTPLSVAALVLLWGTRWRYPLMAALATLAWQVTLHAESLVAHSLWLYFIQDAGSNLFAGAIFAQSLRPGQERLCTRIARFSHPEGMPPTVARYCDGLTLAWVLYFGACVLVAAALFLSGQVRAWSWFANVLNWPMTIAFFICEYPVRMMLVPARDRATLRDSILGFIAAGRAQAGIRQDAP